MLCKNACPGGGVLEKCRDQTAPINLSSDLHMNSLSYRTMLPQDWAALLPHEQSRAVGEQCSSVSGETLGLVNSRVVRNGPHITRLLNEIHLTATKQNGQAMHKEDHTVSHDNGVIIPQVSGRSAVLSQSKLNIQSVIPPCPGMDLRPYATATPSP